MGRHSKPQPMVLPVAPPHGLRALRSTLQVPVKGPGASQVHKNAVLIEKGKQLYLEEARRRRGQVGAFSFTHVPSHCKIPGNERADELAARGEPQAGEANLRCIVGRFENCGPPRSARPGCGPATTTTSRGASCTGRYYSSGGNEP